MAAMTTLRDILNGTPGDATDVEFNFNTIESYIASSVVKTDGTNALADNAVVTSKIAADAVTNAKIADDQIDSEHYVDGSIDTAHLADDAVTAEKLAPAIPLGVMGYAQITANSARTSGTTELDIAGLTVTFTAVAGRRYKATVNADVDTVNGSDIGVLHLKEGATFLQRSTHAVNAAGYAQTNTATYVTTSSISGSKTWKVTLVRAVGTGSVAIVAGPTTPAFILVEDIGAL